MKILVFVQQEDGQINPVSIEAIAGAQQIASQCDGSLSALTFNATDICDHPVSFPKYKSAFFIIGKISFILKLDSEKQFILIFEFGASISFQ